MLIFGVFCSMFFVIWAYLLSYGAGFQLEGLSSFFFIQDLTAITVWRSLSTQYASHGRKTRCKRKKVSFSSEHWRAVFSWHATNMNVAEEACPTATRAHHTKKSEMRNRWSWSGNLEWHRSTQGLIRPGAVTNRATTSCRLQPKWRGIWDSNLWHFQRQILDPLD